MQEALQAPASAASYAGLAADDTGGDGRPPLVLLHGLTFDRRTWVPIVERVRALDPHRRVVAFDLPGHGGSAPQLPHDLDHLIRVLEGAFADARIEEPVLVGHSMSGGLASLYGASHPLTAIVNVDQPPDLMPFARLIHSLAEQLRGPGFDDVWPIFADSFHVELLPAEAQALVAQTSVPSQTTVLGYWQPLLEVAPEHLGAQVHAAIAALAARRTPYLLVMGSPLPDALDGDLRRRLPALEVLDWSPSGHFPHLAHVDRFAALLVELGR